MSLYIRRLLSLTLAIIAFLLPQTSNAMDSLPVKASLHAIEYSQENALIELQFTIPDGWKVYSNSPGDTGLPIELDFSNSNNLKSCFIDWPVPTVMIDKFGQEELKTNVYNKNTSISIKIIPIDYEMPIELNVHLTFGACEKVCVGQEEDFYLVLEPGLVNKTLHKNPLENYHPGFESIHKDNSNYLLYLFAVIGGFILNFMPCVLPVLTLKILNIIKYSGLDKRQVRINLLATSFGMIATFVLLALLTIISKSIGLNFGWGFQFQEPWFLIFIAVILAIFASNLWGDYEINLPYWLNEVIAKRSQDHNHSINNSIAAGAFATLLATPCTAPFLSVSVAFALSQSALTIFLIYFLIGVGMALPYLILASAPQALRIFPKPGRWMVNLRKIFAIFLLLTLAWILYVLAFQVSYQLLILLMLALYGCRLLLQKKISKKLLKLSILLILIILTFVFQNVFDKTEEFDMNSNWEKFDESQLESYIANDRTVLVDITAEWCLICKANKFIVLDQKDIINFLNENNVVLMRGDYTNRSMVLDAYLRKNNRYGIPLNVVYGPKNKDGIVMSEVLSKKELISAIKKASN